MEKLPKSRHQHLAPVRLYLDDIERILETLRKGSDTVSIHTDEYALANLGQLTELGKEYLTCLELAIQKPYVAVRMHPDGVWLHIERDEPVSRWIFEEVQQILASRKQPLAWLISSFLGAFVAIGLAVVSLVIAAAYSNRLLGAVSLAVLALGVVLMIVSLRRSEHKCSIIIPMRRIDTPSFLKRNRDELLQGIIVGVIVGIIGFVLGLLAKKCVP